VEQNFIFHVADHALCLSDSKQGKCKKPVARGGKAQVNSANSSWASVYVAVILALLSAALNLNK
jgi:hypothetical protein